MSALQSGDGLQMVLIVLVSRFLRCFEVQIFEPNIMENFLESYACFARDVQILKWLVSNFLTSF